MKLRNKKTGEIIEYKGSHMIDVWYDIGNHGVDNFHYSSLKDFNEDWEDYEEPKKYYYFDSTAGKIYETEDTEWECDRNRKQIGNYFDTKEEAEKAVEKLKAWKRLGNRGFKFLDHLDRGCGQGMCRYEWNGYINGEDLDLLFGGEE